MVADRYRLEHRLGAGGMGIVYGGRDIRLDRQVALKTIVATTDSELDQGRLLREARAMATLRHANIVTVHDVGASDGRIYMVMELVDGGTLADWLRAEPRPWREIVDVFLQAARGLAAAHAAGFVHRDFKPENVLVGQDGIARIGDFGVVRLPHERACSTAWDALTTAASSCDANALVGTPGYIAPEVLRRQPIDGRADQFSFCVSLYEALHGERPFEPANGPGRIAETLGDLRRRGRRAGPRWLADMVVRGLARDPGDRWPTMIAFTEAVERRLGSRCRRSPTLVSIAAAALVASTCTFEDHPGDSRARVFRDRIGWRIAHAIRMEDGVDARHDERWERFVRPAAEEGDEQNAGAGDGHDPPSHDCPRASSAENQTSARISSSGPLGASTRPCARALDRGRRFSLEIASGNDAYSFPREPGD